MKNIISVLVIVLFCLHPVRAQENGFRADSSQVELRQFDESQLEEIRSDDAFNYSVNPNPAGATLWQRFVNWIRSIFMPLFGFEWGGFRVGKLLLYIIMISGLSIAVFRLIKMRSRQIFNREGKSGLDYEVTDENIHAIDFDRLLKEAVDTGQFKRAIRLTYLHALKLLSDAQQIHWEPGKTNLDYTGEIRESSLQDLFGKLGYYFEYAWYGEFEITEYHYKSARDAFHNFRKEGNF